MPFRLPPWFGLEGIRRRISNRRILREFNRSVLLIQDPPALEATFAARVRELLPLRSLILFNLDTDRGAFFPGYHSGVDDARLEGAQLHPRGRLSRWLLVNEQSLLLLEREGVWSYLDPEERHLLDRLGVEICVPLVTLNRLTGILLLALVPPPRPPRDEDLETLELLAHQAALALENAMLYRQQQVRLQRLYRAERLAAVGQLAAGAAHEIRNPLTIIRSTMQYLADQLPDPNRRQMVEELLHEVDRIDTTLNVLLQLTRTDTFHPEPMDLGAAVEQCLSLVEAQASQQGVEQVFQLDQHPWMVDGDPDQLRQLFLNLLLNALQAMPDGGMLTVVVGAWQPDLGPPSSSWAQVEIADTGSGIPAEELERIFDPFFTTKSSGTGLGLPISHRIVERHEGDLEIRSQVGEGTQIFVRIPLKR